MDLGRPTTTTEARAPIGMFQYYMDMWPMQSYILAPLTEADNGPKGRKIPWNNTLEDSFKELKCMVSIVKLHSQYTPMPLINSWVMLLVRIINLFNYYQ